MERNEAIERIRLYNQKIHPYSWLEKEYVKQINEKDYFYGFVINDVSIPHQVEDFIMKNRFFENILPDHYLKLCVYLRHLQEYTCNHQLIRMDARSQDFAYYEGKALGAIGAFYLFYGASLDIKELVYGTYRQLFYNVDFAPVIAVELFQNNQEVIQYCRDVLTSENNTAVLTRDVIKAIEQSRNTELQDLLTQVFLAARLQEGLRQAVVETVDEHQLDYFIKIVDVIQENNLLRYSSVQRGVLTWIGIGYVTIEERHIRHIFDNLCDYLHHEDHCQEALYAQDPLQVYLALYCLGIKDIDHAISTAIQLLECTQRHIMASALIYLKLSGHFDVVKYAYFMDQYQDDEWIIALYLRECTKHNFSKLELSLEQRHFFFDHIEDYVSHMKNQQNYQSKGFEWFSISLQKQALLYVLSQLIDEKADTYLVDKFLPYVSKTLSYDRLTRFMEKSFPLSSLLARKPFMLKEIISSNEELSQYIALEYQKMSLTEDDILQLEARLKTKKAYARAAIIQIISQQNKEIVQRSYERIRTSKVKTIQESALELQQKVPQYFTVEQPQKVEIKGPKEGFGLYKPRTQYDVSYPSKIKYIEKGLFKKTKTIDLSFFQIWDRRQIMEYIALWNQRIASHVDDEYELHGKIYTIGYQHLYPIDYSQHSLDALPLSEVWRQYFIEDQLSEEVIFQLEFINQSMGVYFDKILPQDILVYALKSQDVEQYPFYHHFVRILSYYFYETENSHFQEIAGTFLEMMNRYSQFIEYRNLEYNQEYRTYSLASLSFFQMLIRSLRLEQATDEEFKDYFPVLYESYVRFHLNCQATTKSKLSIPPLLLSRAVLLGILPQEALYEGLLDTHFEEEKKSRYFYSSDRKHMLFEAYRDAYYKGRGIYGKPIFELPEKQREVCQHLRETLDTIVDTLLTMEATRLNEKTEVTDYIKSLAVIRGTKYLILALHVLDNEEIKRQISDNDRNSIFSFVIKHAYPLETDHYQMIENEHFPEKRLVEVAMMAPQWTNMIAEVLKWDGFKEACYYFIAHMKDYNYDQKKAEIVKYTELDPTDLNDGAFDMRWCQKIYQTLGEKRMKLIYQAAKFLCDNAFHTRARKYADACLAKENKDVYLKQVIEKRNKDSLNAYCICPLEDDQDLLERYLYIQQFLKESKKFGAQRQASEKRACEIALMNLARNSRFETVTRLSWIMESQMVSQYQYALEPQKVEDIEIWIQIDEQGKNEICVTKNGKKLKSIPAKLKKHESILNIKDIHTMWNEQYRRSRQMLEKAMEERIDFSLEEIQAIMKNPLVSPMLKKLVLVSDDHFGFYDNGQLKGIDETTVIGQKIRIAHPYDLYHHQVWHDYQKLIFDYHIVQPFKQIFRELYVKLEDEYEESFTKRYTGYQIQPKKAAGALKSRQWNVSYENGLERVYHKSNLIVHLYADADWFSPSEIEAPSIDYVTFTSRQTYQPMKIKDIDDVIFSETMRDVDLAVSTAYVGGVDPVTSFSTMELRKTIIEYTCQLMKLTNVQCSQNYAKIKGQLNDYSVHLGSGIVHQTGGSAIHIVPVYSGKRGKVYLPFLDEDPMTAQILSKTIMLAEDTKIKDPAILEQIVSRKS